MLVGMFQRLFRKAITYQPKYEAIPRAVLAKQGCFSIYYNKLHLQLKDKGTAVIKKMEITS